MPLVNDRTIESLQLIPGLREHILQYSVPLKHIPVSIISRADLSDQMAFFLEQKYGHRVQYSEGAGNVDFDTKTVTTTKGRKISYDLLVACDGVHSPIRRQLHIQRSLHVEHYTNTVQWKAIYLPPSNLIPPNASIPLQHKSLAGGRILPRYPKGHVILLFWRNLEYVNPGNVTNVQEVKDLLQTAMAGQERSFIKALLPKHRRRHETASSVCLAETSIVWDEQSLQSFLESKPGRSHHIIVDRYHDNNGVALVGDAAHGMSSLLGQGCATGLKSARFLVESLSKTSKETANESTAQGLAQALQRYTDLALPEARAITELNLVGDTRHSWWGGPLSLAILSWQSLRKRSLISRLSDTSVSYQQLLQENRWVVTIGKQQWKKFRIPVSES